MQNIVVHRTLTKTGRTICALLQKRHISTNQDEFKCSFPDINIPDVNLVEFVTKDFAKWPHKVAVECGVTGRKYTYDDVRQKVDNFAKALRRVLKLQRGDLVAIHLPNIPEYPICILGILLAGLRITTLNPAYTIGEIQRQLGDSNPKAIITLTDHLGSIKAALNNLQRNIPMVVIKNLQEETNPIGVIDFNELVNTNLDTSNDFEPLQGNETIHLPYSSGTTGLPKGVMLTNRNIVANISQFHSPNHGFIQEATESHQDVVPGILPMFHIFGFTICTLSLLQKGCKIVTIPKFSPEVFLKVLDVHRPNVMQVVPPMVIFLNSHSDAKREYLENLRTILAGAAPLGALDENKFREKVGKPVQILQGYGLTESSPTVMAIPPSEEGKFPGSMGYPMPNTRLKVVKIDDPDAKHLAANQTGELLIKGPQVMKGYFNKPKETEESFVDGWFRTGDMVTYNEDGMFYIADRIKELIKVKGFQVPPAELEEIIRDFPGVAEAAVIGVPHEYSGEVPRAYVVAKVGENVNTSKLQEYVHSKVASYKKLAGGIAIVDSIPKTPSGKILRKDLKKQYEECKV